MWESDVGLGIISGMGISEIQVWDYPFYGSYNSEIDNKNWK